jgi:hypothetical protein
MSDIPDGSGNTIMMSENVNLGAWNSSPSEFNACIIWLPTTTPTVGLNKDFINSTLDADHARPSSYHPMGFNIVKCDGSAQFVAATIQYDVYMRLMTSAGSKYLEPGLPRNPMTPNPVPAILTIQTTPIDEQDY